MEAQAQGLTNAVTNFLTNFNDFRVMVCPHGWPLCCSCEAVLGIAFHLLVEDSLLTWDL